MSNDRKKDHIELALKTRSTKTLELNNCYYEPLLSAHPKEDGLKQNFLNYEFGMPLWISSMTGGTESAKKINHNMARACREFNIGMGLGSCRPLLDSDERLEDFDLRMLMGESPLYTNFGIAQLEELIEAGKLNKAFELTKRLQADGLIIHVNPLQEWAQPEGDKFRKAPIETIKTVCDESNFPIIVKEVGQGMGPKSLELLKGLPIAAIELAGHGGTNFTLLELTRRSGSLSGKKGPSYDVGNIGHTPEQMITWLNELGADYPEIIISGGINNSVRGHNLMLNYKGNAIVGMASEVLRHAQNDYEQLQSFLNELKDSFAIAKAYISRSN